MSWAEVNGIKLYYEMAGEGPRVLYLGLTGDDLRWHPNALDYPLAQGRTILAFDQRGMGQSDKPDRPYTMADYADDAAGLMAAVGWDRAAVVGISFGGMVAQELALRHPDRVAGVVICCASSGGAGGASYPLHELLGLPLEEKARRMVELNDRRIDEAWQAAHPEEFSARVERFMARARVGADDPAKPTGAKRQLEARQGHDTWDRLPGLSMPVLVCGGRYDRVCPPENLEALKGRIPGARLELFEGGHWFFLEDPRGMEVMGRFVDGLGA